MLLDRFGIWMTISRFFCFSKRVDSVHVWQCRPRMTFVSRLWKFAPSKSVLKHLTIQNDHSRVTYRVLLYIILIKLQSKMIISSLGEWFSWWSYLWSVSWDWSTPAVWRVSKFRTLELVSSESTKPLLKPIISPFNISFYQIVKIRNFIILKISQADFTVYLTDLTVIGLSGLPWSPWPELPWLRVY